MSDYNACALQLLIPLLKERRPVLVVGAGSSMFVGYKSWDGLVNLMAAELIPSLQRPVGLTASEFAQVIKDQLQHDKRIEDYYNFLERACGPQGKPKSHDQMHVSLVRLGFSGITTTNYDPVLEIAISKAFESDVGPFRCEEVDMCGGRFHIVHEFTQGLIERKQPNLVLHLHGYYRNPKGIIVTEGDYQAKYGISPEFDQDGKPTGKMSESRHRKILYSLLLQHKFFFVGFRLSDKFFMHVLSVVQDDFELGTDPIHFATMPFRDDADRESQRERLQGYGVMPLFYYVPVPRDGDQEDHSELKNLIGTLDRAVNREENKSTFEEIGTDWRSISNKMMER